MFGGLSPSGSHFDDTWEWDGLTWAQRPTTLQPSARSGSGFTADPVGGGVLLVGGQLASTPFADTWRWDGSVWSLVHDNSQPPPRHSHATAFDEMRGRMLVFGGTGSTLLGDLWSWDGGRWALSTAPGPTPRTRAAMAFDAARGETVMFGGELVGLSNQTWTWNGAAWSLRTPPLSPTARSSHAMAYDRQRARIVLFGGFQNVFGNYFLGDTWEWDGATWLLQTGAAPPPRHGHAMAFDVRRGVTVLYGGVGAGGTSGIALTDTWVWNGLAWTQRLPTNHPGPRVEFGMVYDSARERVVVHGDTNHTDTFEWDGADWSLRTVPASPPARGRSSLAFDTWRQTALLFGGQSAGPNLSDLWWYRPVVAATVTPFGNACAGSTGLPQLAASSRPWLGDTVPIVLGNGPNVAPAAIWGGTSNTMFGPASLPLALAAIAMPGCALFTSIDAVVMTTTSAGVAGIALPIPNQPLLLGTDVHLQGAFFDPAANPAGIAMSAALTLRIGGR